MTSDGLPARLGSLTANLERFMPLRTVDVSAIAPMGIIELEMGIEGVFYNPLDCLLERHSMRSAWYVRIGFGLMLGISTAFVVANDEAEETDLKWSGNVSLVSDYSFRGVSQTFRDPAIQGGIDRHLGNGFAVGAWLSTINFRGSTGQELDLYMTFSGSTDSFDYSFMAVRFEYPSEGDCCNYSEFGGSVTFSGITAGLMMSPEYLGPDGPSMTYPHLGYANGPVDLHLGITRAEAIALTKHGVEDSYVDFSASVSHEVAGLELGVSLVGTDLDIGTDSKPRVIFSISKSF